MEAYLVVIYILYKVSSFYAWNIVKGAIYLLAFWFGMSIVYYGDSLRIGLTIMGTSTMMLRTRMWCKHIEGCYNYQRGHSAQWDWQPYREDSSCFRSIYLSLSLIHTHTFVSLRLLCQSIVHSVRKGVKLNLLHQPIQFFFFFWGGGGG